MEIREKREVGREILTLSNLLCRKIEYDKAEIGLSAVSYMQGGIIRYLMENDKRDIFPRDVVKHFCITRSTVAGILQKMEKNGYIRLAAVPKDARLRKIVLTEKGMAVDTMVKQHVESIERLLVRGMTAEDIDCLFRLTGRMRENLLEELKCSETNKFCRKTRQ